MVLQLMNILGSTCILQTKLPFISVLYLLLLILADITKYSYSKVNILVHMTLLYTSYTVVHVDAVNLSKHC